MIGATGKGKERSNIQLHLMVFPALVLLALFYYWPMLGIAIAFQKFKPVHGMLGSEWIGFENFIYVFNLPTFGQVLWNTIVIACMKIVSSLVLPILVALLLNELRRERFKRTVQTMIYLPHFLSWIILGGILIDILSPSTGIVNKLLAGLGIQPIYFLGDNRWFRFVIVGSDQWKEFGFNTIVYLAALTGINSTLYEAAVIDGASRLRQTWHVTLPGMAPIIVLMATLSLGQILNAGFEQVFNLYHPSVYETGDIIDTFIYRIGIEEAQYSVATAVGLFRSAISFLFLSAAYWLAYRLVNYRIF